MAPDPKRDLKMTMLVTPSVANFSGVMHGGEIVKTLDHVAYACATKFCGYKTITVAINGVSFLRSVPIGSLLHILARVNFTSKSSMEIGMKIFAEDPKTGEDIHTNSAYFMMMAFENGEKKTIAGFSPKTDEDLRRWKNAEARIKLNKK